MRCCAARSRRWRKPPPSAFGPCRRTASGGAARNSTTPPLGNVAASLITPSRRRRRRRTTLPLASTRLRCNCFYPNQLREPRSASLPLLCLVIASRLNAAGIRGGPFQHLEGGVISEFATQNPAVGATGGDHAMTVNSAKGLNGCVFSPGTVGVERTARITSSGNPSRPPHNGCELGRYHRTAWFSPFAIRFVIPPRGVAAETDRALPPSPLSRDDNG